jgi:uncharacterized circularly permuted ATP-grasp superfamily protein
LADLYGEQTCAGRRLAATGAGLRSAAVICGPVAAFRRAGKFLHQYAVDLARSPDGRWWVIADRTQAPSGAGYALENRSVVVSRAFQSSTAN